MTKRNLEHLPEDAPERIAELTRMLEEAEADHEADCVICGRPHVNHKRPCDGEGETMPDDPHHALARRAAEERCECPDPGIGRGCHCRAKRYGLCLSSDDWCGCRCHKPGAIRIYALVRRASEAIWPEETIVRINHDSVVLDSHSGAWRHNEPRPDKALGTAMRLVGREFDVVLSPVHNGIVCLLMRSANKETLAEQLARYDECDNDTNECRALAVLRAVGKMKGWE